MKGGTVAQEESSRRRGAGTTSTKGTSKPSTQREAKESTTKLAATLKKGVSDIVRDAVRATKRGAKKVAAKAASALPDPKRPSKLKPRPKTTPTGKSSSKPRKD
jgi:hypothetical protein